MLVRITNLTLEPDHLPGVYTQLAPGATIEIERLTIDVEGEKGLSQRFLDGKISVVFVQQPTDELFTFSQGALNNKAQVGPTVNDDVTKGYYVGSRWLNVPAQIEYVCFDNTQGAAVWTPSFLTSDVAGPGASLDNEVAVFDGLTGTLIKGAGFRARPPAAADPAGPSADGDLYFNTVLGEYLVFDNSRAKWLSAASTRVRGGRDGNTGPGAFYHTLDGMAFDAGNRGVPVPQGTLTALELTRDNAGAATLEVLVNGAVVATLAHSAVGRTADPNLNVDFPAGVMAFRNQAGGATTAWVQIAATYRRKV